MIYTARILVVLHLCLAALIGSLKAEDKFASNVSELHDAIQSSKPGDVITMRDGIWKNVTIDLSANGTSSKRIFVQAQTPGCVVLAEASTLTIAGSYLEVRGLQFRDAKEVKENIITLSGDFCRITQCAMIDYNAGEHWIYAAGSTNCRIDHCYFVGKDVAGGEIDVTVAQSQPTHMRIDHNYFGRRKSPSNGGEIIRVGLSGQMDYVSRSTIEFNYFDGGTDEPEICSKKSSENVYRYNTFYKARGALVFRHGERNIAYGNYFYGGGIERAGGIRVASCNNAIVNNYIEGTETGIALWTGKSYTEGETRYNPQIDGCVIAYNTLLNNRASLHLNKAVKSSYPFPPKNVVVANNVVVSKDTVLNSATGMELLIGNMFSSVPETNIPSDGYVVVDPQLVMSPDSMYRLSASSPARGAARSGWGHLFDIPGLSVDAGVDYDIDGQSRGRLKDIGCDQYSSESIKTHRTTRNDVGPSYLGGPVDVD